MGGWLTVGEVGNAHTTSRFTRALNMTRAPPFFRLINAEDKEYMKRMLYDMLRTRFEVREEYEDLFVKRTIMFGEYRTTLMTADAQPHGRLWSKMVRMCTMHTIY